VKAFGALSSARLRTATDYVTCTDATADEATLTERPL